MGLLFLVPVLVTLELKHVGEQGVQAERSLQEVRTELSVQDGWEWRAISGRIDLDEVTEELSASRERVSVLLTVTGQGGLSAADARELRDVTADYAIAVDDLLDLLRAGDVGEATELDEEQVDPAFERVEETLDGVSARVSTRATVASRLSDLGILLTVTLALGATTLIQRRRRRAEEQRRAEVRAEARYRALVDQAADLIVVADRSGVVRFLSPSAERVLATNGAGPARDGTGAPMNLLDAVVPADREQLSAALTVAAPGAVVPEVGVRIEGAEGIRCFEMRVEDLTDDSSVGGIVIAAHDVTDRVALQADMQHRALHDSLTGLPNRALLADRFEQALRVGQRDGTRTGLLLIDLDRFKEVNDTFGHHYGDALLTQIGPRLTAALREVDTVARLGGDEFAVLVPGVDDLTHVAGVAAKLVAALQTPFHVEGVDLDVEASIGVVLSGEHGEDPTVLLQRADIAMYVAKTTHVGVSTYDPHADGHSPARLALLGDLRRALEHEELMLHFQPKVSISTGAVVGVEALVRWQHPEHGLLYPDAFIPLAEHTGLIGALTRYVLSCALAQARIWSDSGAPLTVSVNLSARNLVDERLPAQVADLLRTHGVPPALLELEITESAIMTDPDRAQRLLAALTALGVRISIDDFGAGYTSLGQLKNLPVTELKIDRSFVMTMIEDHRNALIVQSVVDLGHNLGLTLVAEGVESAQALATLAAFGCDVAQGYHLCRPVPGADLDRWRRTRDAGREQGVGARPVQSSA